MEERWDKWPGKEQGPHHIDHGRDSSFLFFSMGARKDIGRDSFFFFSFFEDVSVRHNLTDLLRGSC